MAETKLAPVSSQVPLVNPKDGTPTLYFQRMLQLLLDEKNLIADTADENVTDIQDLADTISNLELDDLSDVDITSNAQGDILYRAAGSEWKNLAPGTSGQYLKSNGAGADPSWVTPVSGSGNWTLVNQSGAAITGKTCTITIASPGVITSNSHGYANGTYVYLTTTGALPTGFATTTGYYVVNTATNTFQLSATLGGAAINTTGTQSGTHTVKEFATWTFSANVGNVDVINLASYNEAFILIRACTASVSGTRLIRVSVDNGSSFYSGAADYVAVANDGTEIGTTTIGGHNSSATAARGFSVHIRNLKGPRPTAIVDLSAGKNNTFVADVRDVNALRLTNSAGGNLTAGSLWVYVK